MKLNPRFFDYVRSLNPNVDFRSDVVVSVNGDDATIEWNLAGKPPTDEEIDAANPPVFVPVDRLQLVIDYIASKPDASVEIISIASEAVQTQLATQQTPVLKG